MVFFIRKELSDGRQNGDVNMKKDIVIIGGDCRNIFAMEMIKKGKQEINYDS